MFDQLGQKLTESLRNLTGRGTLSESNIDEALKQMRSALLDADVNFKVVKEFLAQVKEKAIGQKIISGVNASQQFIKIVHDELVSVLGASSEQLELGAPKPSPILVVGLNGAGKTTFCAKLALQLKTKKKLKVLLVPADHYRPAAKEQLMVLAKKAEVECFDSDLSAGPLKIIQQAQLRAKELGIDALIIDTAGRLQVDEQLMGELKQMRAALAPSTDALLVVDAMTGQEAIEVAKRFHETVNLTGIVLSKMDSDARAGAALSMRALTGVPIKFLATGEHLNDLEAFHPDRLAGRLLDQGDVLTLVEKAQDVIDEKQAQSLMNRIQQRQFTIDDFLQQMEALNRLGPFESILKMIPGMGQMMSQVGDLGGVKQEMKRVKVIASSMTKQERASVQLMNEARKRRVAKGSGTSVGQVDEFLAKFKQMQQMMFGMGKMMGNPGQMMKMGKQMEQMQQMGQFPGLMSGGMPGGMPGFGSDEEFARPGFRQAAGKPGKQKMKGKRRGQPRFF